MTEQSYEQIVRRVEDAKRRKAEAEGALKQVQGQLQDFGCGTLSEAEQLLGEMERSVEQLEEKFETDLKQFEEKWK